MGIDIFRIFNIDHPKDFRGHSLSVSDIVEVVDSNSVKSGFYFCDFAYIFIRITRALFITRNLCERETPSLF